MDAIDLCCCFNTDLKEGGRCQFRQAMTYNQIQGERQCSI